MCFWLRNMYSMADGLCDVHFFFYNRIFGRFPPNHTLDWSVSRASSVNIVRGMLMQRCRLTRETF